MALRAADFTGTEKEREGYPALWWQGIINQDETLIPRIGEIEQEELRDAVPAPTLRSEVPRWACDDIFFEFVFIVDEKNF